MTHAVSSQCVSSRQRAVNIFCVAEPLGVLEARTTVDGSIRGRHLALAWSAVLSNCVCCRCRTLHAHRWAGTPESHTGGTRSVPHCLAVTLLRHWGTGLQWRPSHCPSLKRKQTGKRSPRPCRLLISAARPWVPPAKIKRPPRDERSRHPSATARAAASGCATQRCLRSQTAPTRRGWRWSPTPERQRGTGKDPLVGGVSTIGADRTHERREKCL